MNAAELEKLETEFQVSLPEEYKQYILRYPSKLIQIERDFGWKRESPSVREFRNDPRDLKQLNEKVRRPGTPWTSDDESWPEKFFVIGDDTSGDFWSVDTSSKSCEIFFYDHETGEFKLRFTNVLDFEKFLVSEIEDSNRRA